MFLESFARVAAPHTGGKVLTFLDEITNTTAGTTQTESFTFPGQDHVHIAVMGANNTVSISGVTVDGVAATANVASHPDGSMTVGIYTIAHTASGAVDVVVTWSASQDSASLNVWTSTGLASVTEVDTATDTSDSAPSLAFTTAVADGFAIACFASGSGAASMEWINATERHDSVASGKHYSSADAITTGASYTISGIVTGTNPNSPSCAAAW